METKNGSPYGGRTWGSGSARRPRWSSAASVASAEPIRRERLIAGCRVTLSVFSSFALWLDPAEPTRFADIAYTLVGAYAVYSVVLALWVWDAKAMPQALPFVVHGIDLALFGVVILVTAGATSPFFVYFVFALAAATVRWQEAGTLWTTVAALATFLLIGLTAAGQLAGTELEVNRFIIRSIYLAVVAVLLGYVGAHESQLRTRASRLAEWPTVMPTEAAGLVRALLEHAARGLGAPRTLLVWEEPEEPWSNVALWSRGELDWRREAPDVFTPLVPDELAEIPFFMAERPGVEERVRLLVPAGLMPWHRDPVSEALRARYDFGAVLSVPVRGESLVGRLFALDQPDMTSDELLLGEILARQLAVRIDQLALFQRFHESGLAEERIRLARDLHDGVIQSLAGAALRLESARQLVAGRPVAAVELIEEIQDQLTSEQRELRELVGLLEPDSAGRGSSLAGLGERLAKLASRIGRHWYLEVELRNELEDGELGDQLAAEVYRIVQEALVNASRHGRAERAQVVLRGDDEKVRISVSDDGCGFPFRGRYDHAALTAAKLGPVSLKRRIAALGGCLDIDSGEAGARLEVTLPRRP